MGAVMRRMATELVQSAGNLRSRMGDELRQQAQVTQPLEISSLELQIEIAICLLTNASKGSKWEGGLWLLEVCRVLPIWGY